jgi:dynactin complex subunit
LTFCQAESEKYRDALRQKDEELKELARQSIRNAHDAEQRDQNRMANETRISQLEEELIAMREAEGNLDLQKAENLLLKETIDRLRFELDELTNNATTGSASIGPASHTGTVSKSLGAELSRIQQQYESETAVSETALESISGESTGGEEEEIKTIIRRKRVYSHISFPS